MGKSSDAKADKLAAKAAKALSKGNLVKAVDLAVRADNRRGR